MPNLLKITQLDGQVRTISLENQTITLDASNIQNYQIVDAQGNPLTQLQATKLENGLQFVAEGMEQPYLVVNNSQMLPVGSNINWVSPVVATSTVANTAVLASEVVGSGLSTLSYVGLGVLGIGGIAAAAGGGGGKSSDSSPSATSAVTTSSESQNVTNKEEIRQESSDNSISETTDTSSASTADTPENSVEKKEETSNSPTPVTAVTPSASTTGTANTSDKTEETKQDSSTNSSTSETTDTSSASTTGTENTFDKTEETKQDASTNSSTSETADTSSASTTGTANTSDKTEETKQDASKSSMSETDDTSSASTANTVIPANGNKVENKQESSKDAVSTSSDLSSDSSTTTDSSSKVVLPSPIVHFNSITSDNIINAEEAKQHLTVSGTVEHWQAGDRLTLRIGEASYPADVENGKFSIPVDGKTLVVHRQVQAEIVRAENTITQKSHDYKVQTEISQPKITINNIADDDIINLDESKNKVTISGKVENVENGQDILVRCGCPTCSSPKWAEIWTKVQNGEFNVDFAGSDLVADGRNIVEVSLTKTDNAQNSVKATEGRGYEVDVTPPKVEITLDTLGENNTLQETALNQQILVSGRVKGEFRVTDHVILQIGEHNLKAGLLANGQFKVLVDGKWFVDNTTITATLNTQDKAGNSGEAEQRLIYQIEVKVEEAPIQPSEAVESEKTATKENNSLSVSTPVAENPTETTATSVVNTETETSSEENTSSKEEDSQNPSVAEVEKPQSTTETTQSSVTSESEKTNTEENNSPSVSTPAAENPAETTVAPVVNSDAETSSEETTSSKEEVNSTLNTVETENTAETAQSSVTSEPEKTTTEENNSPSVSTPVAENPSEKPSNKPMEEQQPPVDTSTTTDAVAETPSLDVEKAETAENTAKPQTSAIKITAIADDFYLAPADIDSMVEISGRIDFSKFGQNNIYNKFANKRLLETININIGEKEYSAGVNPNNHEFRLVVSKAELANLQGQEIKFSSSSVQLHDRKYYVGDNYNAKYDYELTYPKAPSITSEHIVLDSTDIVNQNGKKFLVKEDLTVSKNSKIVGEVEGNANGFVSIKLGDIHYSTAVQDGKFSLDVAHEVLKNNIGRTVTAEFVKDNEKFSTTAHYATGTTVTPKNAVPERPHLDDTPYFIKGLDNKMDRLSRFPKGLEEYKFTYSFNSAYSETARKTVKYVLNHLEEYTNMHFTEEADFSGNNRITDIGFHSIYGNSHYDNRGYAIGTGVYMSQDFWHDEKINSGYGRFFILHETLHALDLKHPSDGDNVAWAIGNKGLFATPYGEDFDYLSVMSYNLVAPHSDKLLMQDLAYLHWRYGVNPEARKDNNTYTFQNFDRAKKRDGGVYIWDGAGEDTFDASAEKQKVHIDLTPGSWIYSGEKSDRLIYQGDSPLLSEYEIFKTTRMMDMVPRIHKLNPVKGQAFIGYGTQLENAIGSDHNDTIKGNNADNNLYGGNGDDHLEGRDGNDYLDGGEGADTMLGGKGNDIYVVDNAGDVVTENYDEGIDTVYSSLESYTLTPNVEKLYLIGNAKNGYGNSEANTIYGNHLDNILDGKGGNDVLYGGAGEDTFVISDKSSVVTLADFNPNEDKIQLVGFDVTKTDVTQKVTYNKDTGELSYENHHFAKVAMELTYSENWFVIG